MRRMQCAALRRWSWIAAVAAMLATSAPLSGVQAQTQSAAPSGAPAFGECENAVDEAELRRQVSAGAAETMRRAAESVDYREVVEASWVGVRFDSKFARVVDAKIAELRSDRSYVERLLDGNVPSRAEEMATTTAEAIFGSEEFQALQTELQTEIGARLEPLVADAEIATQNRAAECVRLFLGQRYAATVSAAFSQEARTASVTPQISATGAGFNAALSLAGVVAGLLTIVFRRLVRRIVAAVVRRLAGAIVARAAAWVSVIAGVAVLVYELVAGADGVFPTIRDELTSIETKQLIQTALVDELTTVAPTELESRAQAIAGAMIDRWRRFKSAHRAVLELADREPRFRKFVEDQPPEDFEALSVVVAAVKELPPGGDAAVLDALDRGLLNKALRLPDVTRLIETWTPLGVSVFDLIVWRDRAGERFDQVLAANLPSLIQPDALSQPELNRVLALNDPRAAARVAVMPQPARGEALALDTEQLLALTTRFNGDQLTGMFDSLRPAATDAARSRYLHRLLDNPALITRLEDAGDSVAGSAVPSKAIDILLSVNPSWNPFAVLDHGQAVVDGEVSPMVLVHRYGWGLVIAFGVPLLIALWLLRGVGRMLGLTRARRA